MSETRLAIDGGPPAFPDGPPPWPHADEDVQDALVAAYRDGSWGRYEGAHGSRLAELLSNMHEGRLVKLCCSGTVAVELALRGLRVSPGNEVILAGYDFPGNYRCIEAVGARPVLVDIDPGQASLDASCLEDAYGENVTAIIVSHLHGGVANMPAISHWARQRGVAVVEDACQAPGATVAGRAAGTWGDVGILSFGGSKLLTAGRGGAIITPHAEVHQRIKIYGDRGNEAYPLSELQAAVLVPQVAKLDAKNQQRLQSVRRLFEACSDLPALTPVGSMTGESNRPSYYKVAWLYNPAAAGNVPRPALIASLRAEGMAIDAGFRGFTRRSARRCRQVGPLNHSAHASEAMILLHHPVLLQPPEVIDRVAIAMHKVFAQRSSGGQSS